MSQLKKIAATAVAAAALVPVLGVTGASAATADPRLDTFNTAVDMSALNALVAASGGCTTTYATSVAGTPVGAPKVKAPIGSVSIDYTPTLTYSVTVANLTVAYIVCVA